MGVRAPATITEVGRSAVMGEASSDVIGDVASTVVARPSAHTEHDQAHTAYAGRMPWRRPTLGTMSATPDPLFTHIDHVGIAVPDLDAAIAFYEGTYGMRCSTRRQRGAGRARGDDGRRRLRLLHPAARAALPDSTIAKFLDRSGPGMQQLAYRVTDIDAVCATLRERGLRLLYDTPKRGTSNSRVNFIHPKDAGGVLVELVEPASDATH